jgi:hypothetical protein
MSGFEVCEKQCDQCLFSPNRIVPKKRMAEILRNCRRDDKHFICHKGSIAGRDVCCRGFYDTQTSQLMRIAQRLGMVKFVPIPQKEDHERQD